MEDLGINCLDKAALEHKTSCTETLCRESTLHRRLMETIANSGSLCLQSLTDGVDMEDLGINCLDKAALEHKDISLPKDVVFPAWLRDYTKVTKFAYC